MLLLLAAALVLLVPIPLHTTPQSAWQAELAAIQAQAYGSIWAAVEAVRAGIMARPFPNLAGIL